MSSVGDFTQIGLVKGAGKVRLPVQKVGTSPTGTCIPCAMETATDAIL